MAILDKNGANLEKGIDGFPTIPVMDRVA